MFDVDPWIEFGVFRDRKTDRFKKFQKKLLRRKRKFKENEIKAMVQKLRIYIKKMVIAHLEKVLKARRIEVLRRKKRWNRR